MKTILAILFAAVSVHADPPRYCPDPPKYVRNEQPALTLRGQYTDPPGWHRHKCPKCGTVFTHQPDFIDSRGVSHGTAAGHTCPDCGTQSWELYHGPTRPKYYFGDNPPPERLRTQAVPRQKILNTAQNCPT